MGFQRGRTISAVVESATMETGQLTLILDFRFGFSHLKRGMAVPHRSLQSRDFRNPGFDAIQWLAPVQVAKFTAAGTTAHRIASGRDGWVERLGADVLISFKTDSFKEAVVAELANWSASAGWQTGRVFGKFLPKKNEERIAPVLISGDPTLPMRTVVEEAGVKFGLDFEAGYSAGLFIDQRANRAFVRQVKPSRLLNTFAYTCSFSVVAALGGAETVSVDLSKKSLDRGKENFALNGVNVEKNHRFYADDVADMLPRLGRRGEKFDTIVLDPPTFSRGTDGRRWQVEDGMENLLMSAMELAAPNARILLSTNCTKLQIRDLEAMGRFAMKTLRRGGTMHRESQLVDFPASHGATTLWILLRG